MTFEFNDGGRSAAGYAGHTGDCVCRSICIIAGLPYQQVYDRLTQGNQTQRRSKGQARKWHKSAKHGVYTQRKWFKDYMTNLGFVWVPTMTIGSGCTVHLREEELPKGRLVVSLSRHLTAVIDGTIHDTYNPDRGGKRCVYGYWVFNFKPFNQ